MEECQKHGMTPNLGKGKTEVVFQFAGPHAQSARARYFGPRASGTIPVITEFGRHDIRVVSSYVHLGGLVHHSGACKQELERRFAIAHAALADKSRLLFRNPRISFD